MKIMKIHDTIYVRWKTAKFLSAYLFMILYRPLTTMFVKIGQFYSCDILVLFSVFVHTHNTVAMA